MKMGPENFGPGSETYARPVRWTSSFERVDGMEKKKIKKEEDKTRRI